MRVCAAVLVLFAVFTGPVLAQKKLPSRPARPGEITEDDMLQKEGTIAELTRVKSGKLKLELKTSESEKKEVYNLTHMTMVYKLTERNKDIFREQDKLADVAKDVNKVRARLKDLPQKELELQQSQWDRLYVDGWGRATYHTGYSQGAANSLNRTQLAWKQEEKDRQDRYGPRITLIKGLEVIVFAVRYVVRKEVDWVYITATFQEIKHLLRASVTRTFWSSCGVARLSGLPIFVVTFRHCATRILFTQK